MNLEEIGAKLIAAIEELQRVAGRDATGITNNTRPICDVQGFDSYSGLTALHIFEDIAQVDLSDLPCLFFADNRGRNRKIKQVAKDIQNFLEKRKRLK